jgi:hypothetical protein
MTPANSATLAQSVGVSVSIAPVFQVVEHVYQVAQAAA